MGTADRLKELPSIPFFSDFQPEELDEFLALARDVEVIAGRHLYREGDAPDGMYLLEKGRVRITTRLPGDEIVELWVNGPGDLVGEVALVADRPRATSAEVVEAVRALYFSAHQFEYLRGDLRPAAFKAMNAITRAVCGRIRRLNGEIGDQTSGAPEPVAAPESPDGPARQEEPMTRLRMAVLQSIPLFGQFTRDELERFLAPLALWRLPRGHRLFAEAQPPTQCYLVVRGALRLTVGDGPAREQLMVLGPGNFAGEVALLDGQPQPVMCEAREDSMVLELSRERFRELHGRQDDMAFKFFETVNHSMVAKLHQSIRTLARLAAERRMSDRIAAGPRPQRRARTPSGAD